MVEMQFDPVKPIDMYRRLFTLTGGVSPTSWHAPPYPSMRASTSDPDDIPPVTRTRPVLGGNIVWASPCPDPYTLVPGFQPPAIGVTPAPNVDGYFAQHWAAAQEVSSNGSHNYSFNPPGGTPGFYRTSWSGSGNWSLYNDHVPTVDVTINGTVIWMFDHGVKFEDRVNINGSLNDLLVIVAKEGGPPSERLAIAFGGSFNATVPLVLVSDAGVGIEHDYNGGQGSTGIYVSVFADNLLLMGPRPSGTNALTLMHPIDAVPDQVNGVVTKLAELGLLPNTQPGFDASLVPLAGTWQELGTN
jgi:hypothetical protein